jgi:hypothetical protein
MILVLASGSHPGGMLLLAPPNTRTYLSRTAVSTSARPFHPLNGADPTGLDAFSLITDSLNGSVIIEDLTIGGQ